MLVTSTRKMFTIALSFLFITRRHFSARHLVGLACAVAGIYGSSMLEKKKEASAGGAGGGPAAAADGFGNFYHVVRNFGNENHIRPARNARAVIPEARSSRSVWARSRLA